MNNAPELPPQPPRGRNLLRLAIGAVGIVYGDIGTSPLYAVKECFSPSFGLGLAAENILGVISLIFWALVVIVAVKYLSVVMRADNRGEGGILALLALLRPRSRHDTPRRGHLAYVTLGLLGAALLLSDGIITPAISVVSAVEGLKVATPLLQRWVVPVTVAILVLLFAVQRHGTGGIGSFFGPIMLGWFAMIAAMGLAWVVRRPDILLAANPVWAVRFFTQHGPGSVLILGAVVLCVTGSEALYADLGHFGRRPIRTAWYVVVFPALLLNYFGQGALLLERGPAATANPFYSMVPAGLLYLVVVVATIATIIASQALISGAFSLTQQAIQLGYAPCLKVVHTAHEVHGQIYVPEINALLGVACVALVLAFRSSDNLAAAYGIAVTGTMATTSVLLYGVARERWGWPRWLAGLVTGGFLAIDLLFLSGNIVKVAYGGWFPLAVSALLLLLMTTWQRGREILNELLRKRSVGIDSFSGLLAHEQLHRVPGVAVFLMTAPSLIPPALLHHLKLTKVLHERVILLAFETLGQPEVPDTERLQAAELGNGMWHVVARYGFMQPRSVPEVIRLCEERGIVPKGEGDISYFLGRVTVRTDGTSGMSRLRKRLFLFLLRRERPVTEFFDISPNRMAEIGIQVSI